MTETRAGTSLSSHVLDPEAAKAIQETAKFGSKALDTANNLGGAAGRVFGSLTRNLVGILDDTILHIRIRRWGELCAETQEILQTRGVKETIEPSPSIAIPLIEAAINETRDQLKQLWSRLLAAAMDPARVGRVRQSFIDLLKKMEPIDALVLQTLAREQNWSPNTRDAFAKMFNVTSDEIEVSFANLVDLKCIFIAQANTPNPILTSTGRLLIRAVAD